MRHLHWLHYLSKYIFSMNDYEQFSQFFCSEWKEGEVIFAACSLSFLHFILIFFIIIITGQMFLCCRGAGGRAEPFVSSQVSPFSSWSKVLIVRSCAKEVLLGWGCRWEGAQEGRKKKTCTCWAAASSCLWETQRVLVLHSICGHHQWGR